MEGWVDLGYPVMHQSGVELAISRSRVQRHNHYATKPSCVCDWYVLGWIGSSCTNGHVRLAAGIDCLSNGVDEVPADAEVADLHFTVAVDENVWRFHVAMNHLELCLKIVQSLYNLHIASAQCQLSITTAPCTKNKRWTRKLHSTAGSSAGAYTMTATNHNHDSHMNKIVKKLTWKTNAKWTLKPI